MPLPAPPGRAVVLILVLLSAAVGVRQRYKAWRHLKLVASGFRWLGRGLAQMGSLAPSLAWPLFSPGTSSLLALAEVLRARLMRQLELAWRLSVELFLGRGCA